MKKNKNKFNLYDGIQKINKKITDISRCIPVFNKQENELLTKEFRKKFFEIREQNSQDLYTFYYLPNAVRSLVKTKRLLTNENIKAAATLLFLQDVAEGKINEFNWFKEEVQE